MPADLPGQIPMPADLPGQIPRGEPIASVTADGAHGTRGRRDAIARRGTDALIPPRRNAKPRKRHSPGAGARSEALRAIKRLGRAIWRRWGRHHRPIAYDTAAPRPR